MAIDSKPNLFFSFLLAASALFPEGSAQKVAPGVKLVPLTKDGKCRAVAWAWHGDLVAFVREISKSSSRLLVMRSDGTGEKVVTPIGNPFYAEWSWDGKKLAYEFSNEPRRESQGGIFVYDTVTGKSASLSPPHPRRNIDEDEGPRWSCDSRLVVFKVLGGPSRTRQVWVGNPAEARGWQILADLGSAKDARFSPVDPGKIALKVRSTGGNGYDLAVTDPEGRDFLRLTDIGAETIRIGEPMWKPSGDWIAYTSNLEMTRSERKAGRRDLWLIRPNGTGAVNLTKATSPATEKQLYIGTPHWSWDGRWILCWGLRFTSQGYRISTLYLVDPRKGGYEPLLTSHPGRDGEYVSFYSMKWSYDSSKIALLIKRSTVRNWPTKPTFENIRWALALFDMKKRKLFDLVEFDVREDRKMLLGSIDRGDLEDISWSPDGKSLLVTIATIISEKEWILQPDVYRVDLPDRFIDPSAASFDGPPMGRASSPAPEKRTGEKGGEGKGGKKPAGSGGGAPPSGPAAGGGSPPPPASPSMVIASLELAHIPVKEAMDTLSSEYSSYLKPNAPRNYILFKGPPKVLEEIRKELAIIDRPAPHILVDLLAVELSEEANRTLGLDATYAEGHFAFFQPAGNAIRDLTPDERLKGLITFPGVGQSFYQGVGRLPREFFVRLNTLVSEGKGTILANPRTVSMSGKEASINIRKTLNFFFNEGFDTAGRPIVKKSDISAETLGRITPTLLPDGKIHLKVEVGVGSFTFTPDGGLPEQTSRKSTTEVTVQEGETIVIGGLRQQKEIKSVVKVPILGDIPLLGLLFTSRKVSVKSSVLTIFITPRILRERETNPSWPQLDASKVENVPILVDKKKGKTPEKK